MRRAIILAISLIAFVLGPSVPSGAQSAPGRVLTNSGSAFGGLIEFNLDGTNTINLTPNTFDGGDGANLSDHPSVSSNGLVAFESNRDGTGFRVYVVNVDGTGLRQVTTSSGAPVLSGNVAEDRFPVISPDGTRVAFLSRRHSYALGYSFNDIFVVNVDGTNLHQVSVTTGHPRPGVDWVDYTDNRSAVWSPDSTQLAFRGSRWARLTPDANESLWEVVGKINVAAATESDTFITADCGGGAAIDWSSDGKIVYSYGGAVQGCSPYYPKYVIRRSDGTTTEISGDILGAPGNGNGAVRFSPDGTRLMYFNSLAYSIKGAVTLINIDGTGKTTLPYATGINDVYGAPLWWMPGSTIPTPAMFGLSPNPVNISNGGTPVQLQGTLYDASGNVIVKAATGWRLDCCFSVTSQGAVSVNNPDPHSLPVCANNAGIEACVTVQTNSGAPAVTSGGAMSTRAGSNIAVRPSSDTSLTFSSVTTAGTTTAMAIDPATAGTWPTGYSSTSVAYTIASTAVITGQTTVCLQAPSATDASTFVRMRVLHAESGALVDRTILAPGTPAPDFATKTICASVSSLSPFAIGVLTAPAAPSGLTATADGSLVQLSWTAPADNGVAVTGYTVEAGSSSGAATTTVTTGSTTPSFALTLPSAGLWYVRVRAASATGNSAASNEVSVTTSAVTSRPRQLSVAVSGANATFTWQAPVSGTPTAYVMDVGSGTGRADLLSAPIGSATTITAPLPNGTFYIRVRAQNAAGASAPSNEVVVTYPTPVAAPGAPSALSASVSGNAMVLSWQPPASGGVPEEYLLEAGTSSGGSELGSFPVGPGLWFSHPSVPNGTYYVRVRARNEAGTSQASNEVKLVVGEPVLAPGAPSNLAFATGAGGALTLTWSAPTTGGAASGYVIDVGSTPGVSDLLQMAVGTSRVLSVSGVPSGAYFVRVRAINAAGSSPASNEILVTIP